MLVTNPVSFRNQNVMLPVTDWVKFTATDTLTVSLIFALVRLIDVMFIVGGVCWARNDNATEETPKLPRLSFAHTLIVFKSSTKITEVLVLHTNVKLTPLSSTKHMPTASLNVAFTVWFMLRL